jgi:predicted DNA-binding protein with PD1-like motif
MKIQEANIRRIFFARLSENEDILEAVERIANQRKINSAIFFIIGTLKRANVGFYLEGEYQPITISHPLEVVSCIGNISKKDGKEIIAHAHITVSNGEGKAFGGHVLRGCLVGATCELTILEVEGITLDRKLDKKTGLYLWAFKNSRKKRRS